MAPQIAGRLRIALIEETTNELGSGAALNRGTYETVRFAVVNVFDDWEGFKEYIYWCVPLLSQPC